MGRSQAYTQKRFSKKGGLNYKKRWVVLFVLSISVLLIGCVPKYYRPALGQNKPAEITVSAYTQSGCLDCLKEEARNRNVAVNLKEI